jgi:Zn-dependent peptidase ImmA (M78 family)
MNRQLSLLEQHRLTHPQASDAEHVVRWADEVIAELGLEPPIDPAIVASYLGVARVETDDLDVAGCLVCQRMTLIIKVRRDDPAARRRFTICHECCHTFFPGFARQTQFRCNPRIEDERARSLEQLCDAGASELLLPRRHFERDLAKMPFGVEGVSELAAQYEASLEATGHRVVIVSSEPILLTILEVANKPRDKPGAHPQLRVRSSRSNAAFPFVRRHKSVSPGTPLHRALEGEVIHEITALDEICAEPMNDVEVSAKLCPYGPGRQRLRVIALVRPATLRRKRAS